MKLPEWNIWEWIAASFAFSVTFAIVYPIFLVATSSLIYGKPVQRPEFLDKFSELVIFIAGNLNAIMIRRLINSNHE